MIPELITGSCHTDDRGFLKYNNLFNAKSIKRIYTIENKEIGFFRRWQGHKVEQRWFVAVDGIFNIDIIKIDNWKKPSKNLKIESYKISNKNLDILHIPNGYVTSIKAETNNAKLLVLADYELNEIDDNYKFPSDYFEVK